MSRLKLMVLSVMAVFAVGAVAASAASAAPHWVIEGKALAAGESETVLALISGPAILHGLIGKVGFELTCTAAHASGTIKGTNTDAAPNGIPFAGCTVNHPTGCTAVEPISTKALTSELLTTEEGKRRQDTWTAPAEEFAEITVSGTACSVEGKYLVKGKAQCEGESGEAVDFSCLFNAKSGSVLKLGVNETDFLAHFLFLLTGAHAGKKWGTS